MPILSETSVSKIWLVKLIDQFQKLKEYHEDSLTAEEKCNTTVSGAQSPAEESNKTNTLIKDLLEASQDKFLQDLAAHNKSIQELQGKAQDLDQKVHQLAHKVSLSFSNQYNVPLLSIMVPQYLKSSRDIVFWRHTKIKSSVGLKIENAFFSWKIINYQ